MNTVHIVGGGQLFRKMFEDRGWSVVPFEDADFIQFTGGEDVTPELYGEKNTHSGNNLRRDQIESEVFNRAVEQGKNILGVCRGSQFLTVMSGHSLWQDVDNHAMGGTHKATLFDTGEEFEVTSTHHQMMRLDGETPFKLLVTAGRTNYKQGGGVVANQDLFSTDRDVESVFYPETNSLAFQPHPEFTDKEHSCNKLYFRLINECFK